MPSRFHFPASLHSTVITRFVAITDALTSAGRFFGPFPGMNTVPVPVRKFTAYPDTASYHSVSNHVMPASGLSVCHEVVCFSSGSLAFGPGLSAVPLLGLGPWLKDSRLHSTLSHRIPPNRVHFGELRVSRSLRTGSSLSVALHGRISPPQLLSTTGHLDSGLTGTFTPLRCRLRSRTMARLRRSEMASFRRGLFQIFS